MRLLARLVKPLPTIALGDLISILPLPVQMLGFWLGRFPAEGILLTGVAEAVVLIGASRVRRMYPAFSLPFARKASHILGGTLVVALGEVHGREASAVFVFSLLAPYLLYEHLRWSKGIPSSMIPNALSLLGSPEELERKPFYDLVCGLLGILIVSLSFPRQIAQASTVTLTLGDGFATIAGKAIRSPPLRINERKTISGSVVGLVASFAGCLPFVSPEVALMGSFSGMLAEALPMPVSDNLTVPMASASAMYVLCYML